MKEIQIPVTGVTLVLLVLVLHVGQGGCFPGDSNVLLFGGKIVKMSQLKIGDQVEAGMNSLIMSESQVRDKVQVQ